MQHKARWDKYFQLMEERPELFDEGVLPIEKDRSILVAYEQAHDITLGVVYESAYHLLVVDLIRDDKGGHYPYERILPAIASGAVVAVPLYQNQFVLLRQYRHAIRAYQYAFPRGFGEANLAPKANLAKELSEEIGARIGQVAFLGQVTGDSGILANHVDVYEAEILDYKLQVGHEGIDDVVLVDEATLRQWIGSQQIDDSYTLAAFMLWETQKNVSRET